MNEGDYPQAEGITQPDIRPEIKHFLSNYPLIHKIDEATGTYRVTHTSHHIFTNRLLSTKAIPFALRQYPHLASKIDENASIEHPAQLQLQELARVHTHDTITDDTITHDYVYRNKLVTEISGPDLYIKSVRARNSDAWDEAKKVHDQVGVLEEAAAGLSLLESIILGAYMGMDQANILVYFYKRTANMHDFHKAKPLWDKHLPKIIADIQKLKEKYLEHKNQNVHMRRYNDLLKYSQSAGLIRKYTPQEVQTEMISLNYEVLVRGADTALIEELTKDDRKLTSTEIVDIRLSIEFNRLNKQLSNEMSGFRILGFPPEVSEPEGVS